MLPIRSIVRGAVAGALGTLAMDLLWYSRYRRSGGEQAFMDWETSAGLEGYDDAPAPAQVAKLVAGYVGVDLPPETSRLANNAVHWGTGIGWGKAFGMVAGVTRVPSVVLGPIVGGIAWLTSYVVLGAVGIYQPMNEYDRETLVQDFSAHMVFGFGTGAAYAVLSSRR